MSAVEAVRSRLPATALLAFSALTLALLVGFPLGIVAALRARTRLDQALSLLSLLGQALPNFWIGIVFILVFARNLRLLPSAGYGTLRHLILPAVTLSLILLGVIMRLVRSGMIEVMNEPYILTARAKGLLPRVVVFNHAVRNMLIPVITLVGLQLGQLLSGTVVVEVVFGWPGIGRLLVDAITNRDYTVVQAVVMFMSTIFVLINLVVDLLYGYLDPRVRLGAQ
jgi:ABC-type dipeptide/oligopeptide/nickel transport system permease component